MNDKAHLGIVINNNLLEIDHVIKQFDVFAKKNAIPPKVRRRFIIAFDELLNNVISYGYKDRDLHIIQIKFDLDEDSLVAEISDDGIPFNPVEYEKLDVPDSDEQPLGGLGIHLARSMVDEVNYKRVGNKNIVSLTKYFNQENS